MLNHYNKYLTRSYARVLLLRKVPHLQGDREEKRLWQREQHRPRRAGANEEHREGTRERVARDTETQPVPRTREPQRQPANILPCVAVGETRLRDRGRCTPSSCKVCAGTRCSGPAASTGAPADTACRRPGPQNHHLLEEPRPSHHHPSPSHASAPATPPQPYPQRAPRLRPEGPRAEQPLDPGCHAVTPNPSAQVTHPWCLPREAGYTSPWRQQVSQCTVTVTFMPIPTSRDEGRALSEPLLQVAGCFRHPVHRQRQTRQGRCPAPSQAQAGNHPCVGKANGNAWQPPERPKTIHTRKQLSAVKTRISI